MWYTSQKTSQLREEGSKSNTGEGMPVGRKGARKSRRRKKKTKPQMLRPDKQVKKLDTQRKTRLTLGYSQGDWS